MEFPRVLFFDLWNFHHQRSDRFSSQSGKSEKVWEFVRGKGKSGKLEIFLQKSEMTEENFYPCWFLTSIKKSYAPRNMCIWIVYDKPVAYMMLLFASTTLLRWFNISNLFYFNLSELVFHLNQKRKLHATSCVVSLLRHSLVIVV